MNDKLIDPKIPLIFEIVDRYWKNSNNEKEREIYFEIFKFIIENENFKMNQNYLRGI